MYNLLKCFLLAKKNYLIYLKIKNNRGELETEIISDLGAGKLFSLDLDDSGFSILNSTLIFDP